MKDFLAKVRGCIYSYWANTFKRNITIGPRLKIYKKFSISGQGSLEIGSDCIIDGINGDRSQFVCFDLRSPDSVIKIGNSVALYAARLAAKFEITVGHNATIEESVIFDTDYHSIDKHRDDPIHEKREKCRVMIGDRVYIGPKSAILKGVTLEDDVVVMPGSVVISSIKPGTVVFGNPAKPLPDNVSPT